MRSAFTGTYVQRDKRATALIYSPHLHHLRRAADLLRQSALFNTQTTSTLRIRFFCAILRTIKAPLCLYLRLLRHH